MTRPGINTLLLAEYCGKCCTTVMGVRRNVEKTKGNYRKAINRLLPTIKAQIKAKTHTTHEMRKISSAKRGKKWKQISVKAIKEYHAWIEEELQWQKARGKP